MGQRSVGQTQIGVGFHSLVLTRDTNDVSYFIESCSSVEHVLRLALITCPLATMGSSHVLIKRLMNHCHSHGNFITDSVLITAKVSIF